MAEDNLGTSDLLEFAIYLPALSLDFVYFFFLAVQDSSIGDLVTG